MRKFRFSFCEICKREMNSRGFSQHVAKTHGVNISDYIVRFEYGGIHPTCKCGCGEKVTIRSYAVMDYIDGHSPAGRFSLGVSPKRKNYDSWRANLTAGIRHFVEKMRSKDPNFRRGSNNNFFGLHHSEETKSAIKRRVEDQISTGRHAFLGKPNGRLGRSSLEDKFEDYLKSNSIVYERSYRLSYVPDGLKTSRNKYYDFYIPEINLLIEINGTFWHPRENSEKLTKIQVSNLNNDKFKLNLARARGYDLLSVYDIELDEFMKNEMLQKMISSRKDVPLTDVEYATAGGAGV